jgi:hypothetical protein
MVEASVCIVPESGRKSRPGSAMLIGFDAPTAVVESSRHRQEPAMDRKILRLDEEIHSFWGLWRQPREAYLVVRQEKCFIRTHHEPPRAVITSDIAMASVN